MANVYPAEELVDNALKKAEKIASMSQIATKMGKEAVNKGIHPHPHISQSARSFITAMFI